MKASSFSTLVIAILFAASGSAFAQSHFDKKHPRRAQVNNRLEYQKDRIHEEVKEGDMSKKEAHKLRKEDRHIRKEERQNARHHDGQITKKEQNHLNKQENKVSHQIAN